MSLTRWDRPTGAYTTTIPPGVAALRDGVAKHFGIARKEVIRDRSRCQGQSSEHCECSAVDFFPPNLDQQLGRRIFDWCVANADDLGIQSVIFAKRVAGFGNPSERAYTGSNPHLDHVHVGIDRWGRTGVTPALVARKLGTTTGGGQPTTGGGQPTTGGRRPLREGDTGDEVAALQAWLNRMFPSYCRIDLGPRRYGPQTVLAVAEFQRRCGITGPDANGRTVGPRTWAALERHGYRRTA